uniref:Uncharacterized protein n=1 Tax=Timema cristinae TaxID=61476 RepID=A0A7R9CVY9_TIMCR|nr:unnamed protein product [Timema cristinae]
MLINEQPIEEQKDDEPFNRITHSEGLKAIEAALEYCGQQQEATPADNISEHMKANVRLSPTCEAVCWSGAGIESWAEKESSTIKSSSEDLKEAGSPRELWGPGAT